ncbi:ATP-binding protein [Massilia niabensis]|uniref:histidine kinase n=1 Tax=Massilia niabensis TaxID=544910 RepID=A0ABW0LAN6_9BURK
MQIRAYLYLMAAAILVPVILFAGFVLSLLDEAGTETALARVALTSQQLALLVDDDLSDAGAALRVLAASPTLARGDLKAFYEEARRAPLGPASWTVLLDEQGAVLVNTLAAPGTPLPVGPRPAYLDELFANGRPIVRDVMPGRYSGRLITAVTVPVQAGGRRYALSITFSTDHFRTLLADARLPADWQVDIVDGAGHLVASNLGTADLVGQDAPPQLVAAARGEKTGVLDLPLRHGGSSKTVFHKVAGSDWVVAVGVPPGFLATRTGDAKRMAALALVAALACACALASWLARAYGRSMGRAIDAAGMLGRGKTPPKLRSRIVEIDRLLAALRQAGAELRRAQVFRDSAGHERQSQLERETHARQTAEEENRAKDQFLAMLGHELRNPLAPIVTAAQLLKMPDVDGHRARYAGDVISRQVEHMNRLLGDMLDVSRVTRGLVTLNLEDVDLRDAVERAVEQTRPLLEERQHRLELRLPGQPVTVRGDQTRLTQVVANLLTNSAKYTPVHGNIQLSLACAADEATLSVADDGEGITPELLPRVFDLFSQGERKADRAQGGLGLGLALVRSMVQLHGGTIDASSPGRGGGSIFTVRLPLKQELAALAQPTAPRRARDAAPQALRVMLVDDNIDAAVSLSLLLEAAGDHLVSTYYDAASALEWAAFERPDVFILDIGLPDMNGYELARRVRAMPQFASTLLIALTGYGQLADKTRAREAGFDLHIAKPAEPEEILAALTHVHLSPEAERAN